MGAALDDAAGFDDEDLIGAADGGEAVGDDEGGAAAHQVRKAFLNEGFGFGVEAGGGFVENQDARVGQDGAGDGDALRLAAGELDAAFADDGVVLLFEAFGEFVDAGDAAGVENFVFGGVGAGEGDVFADGAVEEKGFLQDDAELGAVAESSRTVERSTPSTRTRPVAGDVEGGDQADDGGFAGAGRADQRGDGAGLRVEADVVEDVLAGFVGEADVFEDNLAVDAVRGRRCGWGLRLRGFSFRISRVRSRPARASVICVPMATIWKTGAIRKPRKAVKANESPRVRVPARICGAPSRT